MPLFRTQSAAKQSSLAPHDSKARLRDVTTRRRSMAKPCTPHLHCAACAALQASDRQCWGSRGPPLAFSWGFKGAILSRERMAPFPASPRCGDLIAALRAAPFTAITRSGTLPQPPRPRSDTAARPWRKTSHSPRRIRRSSADATLSRLRFRHSPASRSS